MTYRKGLDQSARRHFKAAEELYRLNTAGSQPGCKAVAGYLYGLSGELALKQLMRQSGLKPKAERKHDPYFAHFPELKTLLLDNIEGRLAGNLRKFAEDARLFQNWNTNMRYAPTEDVKIEWVEAWKENAKSLIEDMDPL